MHPSALPAPRVSLASSTAVIGIAVMCACVLALLVVPAEAAAAGCPPPSAHTTLVLSPAAEYLPTGSAPTFELIDPFARSFKKGVSVDFQVCGPGGSQSAPELVTMYSSAFQSPIPTALFTLHNHGTSGEYVVTATALGQTTSTFVHFARPSPSCAASMSFFATFFCARAVKQFLEDSLKTVQCGIGVAAFLTVPETKLADILAAADSAVEAEHEVSAIGASSSIVKLVGDLRGLLNGPTLIKLKSAIADARSASGFLSSLWALLKSLPAGDIGKIAVDLASVLGLGSCVDILKAATPAPATKAPAPQPPPQWSSPDAIDGGHQLESVSCPTASFCVAADDEGRVLTDSDGRWSGPASIDDGTALVSISCASAGFCAADDANGDILVDRAGHWARSDSTDNTLGQMSCVTSSFCDVAGYDDSTGGYVFTWNGQSWSPGELVDPGYKLHSISCASPTFCVAGASVNVFTWPATTWSAADSVDLNDANGSGLSSVSCPSSTFCVTGDAVGNVLKYNGLNWSSPDDIDGNATISAVSCTSSSFCVAVDTNGNAMTFDGTNWTQPKDIDHGATINWASCATSSFCLAVDANGAVLRLS